MSSAAEIYDFDAAIAQVRRNMRRSDQLSLRTHNIAEDYAKAVRHQFHGHDLRLVAETLLFSASCMGSIVVIDPNTSGMVALNVQAVAAVLILDSIALEAADRAGGGS